MYDINVSWKTPTAIDVLAVEHGMSDAELEEKFGLSPVELEAARNGRDTIKPSHIRRICQFFGIEPSELYCEIV